MKLTKDPKDHTLQVLDLPPLRYNYLKNSLLYVCMEIIFTSSMNLVRLEIIRQTFAVVQNYPSTFRFGLSNKFETDFPSGLTGKVCCI